MARPPRLWVVDDDPELRSMLATYLGDQGYQVSTLADGAQLQARLDGSLGGERPDLVVLDLMLPGDDGLTLLRRLRDRGDDLPVVMLTARGDAVDRIIGLEQGADDYLAKPFLPRGSRPGSRRCCAAGPRPPALVRRGRRPSPCCSATAGSIRRPAPCCAPVRR